MTTPFSVQSTEIHGLTLVTPFAALDNRGWFVKDYSITLLRDLGIDLTLQEIFYASSVAGVIRGLHFQRDHQQVKLVRCITGRIFDVVIDLRRDSPTFRRWQGFTLSEANREEVLIPGGCAHGYLVLDDAIVSYKCDQVFVPDCDDGIVWDDPDLAIDWPLADGVAPILSDKDRGLQTFDQFMSRYGGLV